MNCCTNSVARPSLVRFIFLIAVMIALPALGAYAQERPDTFQKVSIKAPRPCSVGATGAVTYLVRNGVELSVSEDWDCDSVADAYDNCVGMANPTQADSDANGLGDVCEAVSFVKAGPPAKTRSTTKPETRTAKAPPAARSKTKAKNRTTIAAEKRSAAKKRRNG
jgi:hypothetical protein